MKGKFLQIVSTVLLTMLLLALPAVAAEKVKISVNGEQALVDSYLKNGVTMIGVNSFARLSGADVTSPAPNSVKIVKNGIDLVLTLNQKEALLGGSSVQLPVAPVKSGAEVYIPLRYISSTFGYNISWNPVAEAVALEINETRDGLTPLELLLKSNQAVQEINTYSMEGSFAMDMDITTDGKKEEIPGEVTTKMVGQIQNKPMQVYMVQTMALPEALGQEVAEMIVETYMTEDKMYIKTPEHGWTVQKMPFPPEFWEEQQDIQSNPLKAAAQMSEMGILLNYGNDAVVDGQEYYVVNATLDMDKFQQGYQKLMQQAFQSMPTIEDDQDQTQEQLQKIMDNLQIDYFYTVYINKQTLLNDIIKFEAKLDFLMELPQVIGDESAEETIDLPQEIQMKMKMKGQFTIKDMEKPFVAPDVKDAVTVPQLTPQAQ